ncbi:MAG: hypothetical protein JXA68_04915 [Ignavibacteriales bacterium]|nr:hypothetical protein [Ignavibacteriales bacterium]
MKIRKFYLFILIPIIFLLANCSEDFDDAKIPNQAPNTFLFLKADTNISQQRSRLQVHWWGDDSDGLIIGYYFKWEGVSDVWSFTTRNDSIFSLPIGTKDTTYNFLVAAVDNEGNGIYDYNVVFNNINLGPEPFIDSDGNSVYTPGEKFWDLGLIDPTPANQIFPIKNTSPTIQWTKVTTLPATSFPVITVGWTTDDLDGIETITKINIALNDTNNSVALNGNVSLVTLRVKDVNAANPTMQVLINGNENSIFSQELSNLKLDDNNVIYVQAQDISGAKSEFIRIPDTNSTWYVKKPKGNFLIIDDYPSGTTQANFYKSVFDTINSDALLNKYDIFDIENSPLPYSSITFYETMKLFDYIFWYSDSKPTIDMLTANVQKYISQKGKIAFSMTFQRTTSDYTFDISIAQSFLPIDDFGETAPLDFMFPNALCVHSDTNDTYPELKTTVTIGFVRTFIPSALATKKVYELSSIQKTGNIAFMDNSKSLFFIGLPLHDCNGNGTVGRLLKKVFFEEFNMSL